MAYDNNNSGALFKNDKQGVDTRPDYRGQINVDGTDYWLSSWLKKDKNGNTFMSLSVQPKDKQSAPKERTNDRIPSPEDFDDPIPF
jgi:hypothetical protein